MIKAKETFLSVLAIWQPVGYSTYQIANTLAHKFQTKVTHTGVLDPLAEGVAIFLLGEERFRKQQYSDGKKTYTFDITFGISTDSFDAMGLVKECDFIQPDLTNINDVLSSFIGKYTQTVPLYSARKVNGKKLFLHAKEGTYVDALPDKKGEIFDLSVRNALEISLSDLVSENLKKISQIKAGQFRQTEIVDNWQANLSANSQKAETTRLKQVVFEVTMSRGLYVRSLSQDICHKLNCLGFVSRLTRTKNGDYSAENCKTLDEVFGKNFDHSMLVSKYL